MEPLNRKLLAGPYLVGDATRSPGWRSLGRSQPALGLACLRRRLDLCRSGRRGEDARVAVFPADSEARRLLLEDLLDHAFARRLGSPLRLDDDQVSRSCRHFLLTSSSRLEPDSNFAIMWRERGSRWQRMT